MTGKLLMFPRKTVASGSASWNDLDALYRGMTTPAERIAHEAITDMYALIVAHGDEELKAKARVIMNRGLRGDRPERGK